MLIKHFWSAAVFGTQRLVFEDKSPDEASGDQNEEMTCTLSSLTSLDLEAVREQENFKLQQRIHALEQEIAALKLQNKEPPPKPKSKPSKPKKLPPLHITL